jgi:hypothetical protein
MTTLGLAESRSFGAGREGLTKIDEPKTGLGAFAEINPNLLPNYRPYIV